MWTTHAGFSSSSQSAIRRKIELHKTGSFLTFHIWFPRWHTSTRFYSICGTFIWNTAQKDKTLTVEGNAKPLRSLRLQINLEKDFAAAVYFSEASSSPRVLSKGGKGVL
jgi:hypothetical protein